MTIADEFILELLSLKKDNKYTFSILSLLYPNLDYINNNFHKDHIHPISEYDNLSEDLKNKYPKDAYDSIINLQMLDANENMAKKDIDLTSWVDKETKNESRVFFLKRHLIPYVSLNLENFAEFFENRKKILSKKLKEILK